LYISVQKVKSEIKETSPIKEEIDDNKNNVNENGMENGEKNDGNTEVTARRSKRIAKEVCWCFLLQTPRIC